MAHDKRLMCKLCGAEFVFSVGEQQFFADNGFQNEPKRCKDCRHKKRILTFPRPLVSTSVHIEATVNCSECGKETTVPFRPIPGRPVFCNECFQQVRRHGHNNSKSMHVRA